MKNIKPIPGFSRYGITPDGELFNLRTGKHLSTSANRRGYRSTILVNDDGVRKTVKRHRMVALTHLGQPSPEACVVNHKNLIPGDDWKDNLEWCTQSRNTQHWVENGGIRKTVTVEVLNIATGKVGHYRSASECSRDLGLSRESILTRVRRGAEYVWPEGKRYRAGPSSDPWPTVKKEVRGRSKEVVLKDLVTGKKLLFNRLTDALPFIGYKLAAVWQWANNPEQPVIPGLFQVQFADSLKPWREVIDFFEELQEGMRIKVVIVTDADWKNPVYYESAVKCANANGLKPTALNYRLKSKGRDVYSDGKRYCYYSDLPEEQKKTIRYEVHGTLLGRTSPGCVQRPSKATASPDAK